MRIKAPLTTKVDLSTSKVYLEVMIETNIDSGQPYGTVSFDDQPQIPGELQRSNQLPHRVIAPASSSPHLLVYTNCTYISYSPVHHLQDSRYSVVAGVGAKRPQQLRSLRCFGYVSL